MLLFPSIKEGFGWPIIEAMACGCAVVTTGKNPMIEAGGKAAVYLNPGDIEEAAEITNEVLEWSETRKKEQLKLGYKNVKRFSRSLFAQKYKNAYYDALGLNVNSNKKTSSSNRRI